jgi:hypothetical protein
VREHAAAGDADDKRKELDGSAQQFFKRDHAEYGEMIDNGKVERALTPEQYMMPTTPYKDVEDNNKELEDDCAYVERT